MLARRYLFVGICNLLLFLAQSQNHSRRLRFSSLVQKRKPGEQVDAPVMTHDATPKSPKPRPEVSPNDAWESVDYAALKGVDKAIAEFGGPPEGSPGDFYGSTCKEVCTSCLIAAKDYPSCNCRASCEMGPDPTICPQKKHGWLGKRVTTPEWQYKAVCNAGKTACDKCVDAEVHKEIKRCQKARSPAICFHKLKAQYASAEAPTRFCKRPELSDCEEFAYVPKENGWTCFDDHAKCKHSIMGDTHEDEQKEALNEAKALDNSHLPPATPCIWCNIPMKM